MEEIKSAEWIYRSIYPHDSNFEKTISAVENALGFKLFVWQKSYIRYGHYRYMGATTAEILKLLLDVSAEPIDNSRCAVTAREKFFRREVLKIRAKLDSAGIPTRTILFSEKGKHNCKNREA